MMLLFFSFFFLFFFFDLDASLLKCRKTEKKSWGYSLPISDKRRHVLRAKIHDNKRRLILSSSDY